MAAAEKRLDPNSKCLARSVARLYFRLLAYKDEYEVARLYSDGSFQQQISEQFSGDFSLVVPSRRQLGASSAGWAQVRRRPVAAAGVQIAGEIQMAARHALSTRSAGSRIASWNGA